MVTYCMEPNANSMPSVKKAWRSPKMRLRSWWSVVSSAPSAWWGTRYAVSAA